MISAGPYDADEPEGSASRSGQYITRKDLKWILGVIFVVGALSMWLYPILKAQTEKSQCIGNFKAMSDALRLYAQENNERLPAAYWLASGEAPALINGRPWTWAAALQPYMNPRRSFRCPTAKPEELSRVANAKDTRVALELSYGMYIGASLASVGQYADPDNAVAIAETINGGALDSFNPHPLRDAQGHASEVDGFLIGYDTGNFEFGAETARVTRLAFPNSRDSLAAERVRGRHARTIHVLYVSGRAATVGPGFGAVVTDTEGDGPRRRLRILPPWTTPGMR